MHRSDLALFNSLPHYPPPPIQTPRSHPSHPPTKKSLPSLPSKPIASPELAAHSALPPLSFPRRLALITACRSSKWSVTQTAVLITEGNTDLRPASPTSCHLLASSLLWSTPFLSYTASVPSPKVQLFFPNRLWARARPHTTERDLHCFQNKPNNFS